MNLDSAIECEDSPNGQHHFTVDEEAGDGRINCEHCGISPEQLYNLTTLHMAQYIVADKTYLPHSYIEFLAVLGEDLENGKENFDEQETKLIVEIYDMVTPENPSA